MELVWVIVIVCLHVCQLAASPVQHKHISDQLYSKSTSELSLDNNAVQRPVYISSRHKRRLSFWERYYDNYLHKENYFSSRVDIASSPRLFALLTDSLRHQGIQYKTLSKDMNQDMTNYMKEAMAALSRDYFEAFRPYKEMLAFMDEAVIRCDGRCSLFNIGTSYEGRPLTGIKIGSPIPPSGEHKPKIWIDAGIHAREWISHTSALYIADMLIEEYEEDPYVRNMVDNYDWYILPCINPDGYNYTWTTDRMWRKTRRPNRNSKCIGTDANRNFNFMWGQHGSSSDPCKDNYRGYHAFSEPEAKAVADFIQSDDNRGSWLTFLTLHSKGQMVLSPWGHTKSYPGDFAELARVGNALTDALSEYHKQQFEFGAASKVLYISSGTSRDWARGMARIKYVYTLELRDRDSRHWLLYPTEIIPTGQEVWAGVKGAMKAIEERGPGEEHNLASSQTTTTISPAKQRANEYKYTARQGRSPIGW